MGVWKRYGIAAVCDSHVCLCSHDTRYNKLFFILYSVPQIDGLFEFLRSQLDLLIPFELLSPCRPVLDRNL